MDIPATDGELIVRSDRREIHILVARDEITVLRSWCVSGEQVAGPHVHHEHSDTFCVLEGELTFEIGREAERITIAAGGFISVPPEVAHSVWNDSGNPVRWLTIHTPDGGFAAFMRGIRDGVAVEWDFAPVPPDGGLPAGDAVVGAPDR